MTAATYIYTRAVQVGVAERAVREALSLMGWKSVGVIRGVALVAGAPLLGLVFLVALPLVGFATVFLMARGAVCRGQVAITPTIGTDAAHVIHALEND